MKTSWFVLLGVIVLAGCGKCGLCEDSELLRTTSPDKLVDAVVSSRDCGATTDYVYRVYVFKAGSEPVENDVVFLADNVDDLNIHWQASKKLVISYKEARIFRFKNFWSSKEIDNFRYVVSVAEHQDTKK